MTLLASCGPVVGSQCLHWRDILSARSNQCGVVASCKMKISLFILYYRISCASAGLSSECVVMALTVFLTLVRRSMF